MALREIGDTRAVEPLLAALKDKNKGVKWEAVVALGEIKDTRAVEPLIAELKDENGLVQIEAVRALWNIGDARAIGPLEELAQNDLYEEVRQAAKEALAKIRGK